MVRKALSILVLLGGLFQLSSVPSELKAHVEKNKTTTVTAPSIPFGPFNESERSGQTQSHQTIGQNDPVGEAAPPTAVHRLTGPLTEAWEQMGQSVHGSLRRLLDTALETTAAQTSTFVPDGGETGPTEAKPTEAKLADKILTDAELTEADSVEPPSIKAEPVEGIRLTERIKPTSQRVERESRTHQPDFDASSETPSDVGTGHDQNTGGDVTTSEPKTAVETLSPESAALRHRIRSTLAWYYSRPLNTRDHNPWELMHTVVAYGVHSKVLQGGPGGRPVTAVGWLCFNGEGNGQRLFFRSGDSLGLQVGPGIQGHDGQWLALLAQAHVMRDYPIQIEGKQFMVSDVIDYEKATCQPNTELTFKLIGLMHYLDSDATWDSRYRGKWSIQRLIREEIAQPIRGAPCGGSHRLMGLSYAVQKRALRGEPVVGEFHRARVYVRDYQRYAFNLQNSDGSFSTSWFRGRGNESDPARNLKTTGHVLEWLAFSLPESDLSNPRVVRAANYLCDLLWYSRGQDQKIGPLGHAIHALVLYHQRRFHGTPSDFLPASGKGRQGVIARFNDRP